MNSSNQLGSALAGKAELLKALRKQLWGEFNSLARKALEPNNELGNESIYEQLSSLLSLEWKLNMSLVQLKKLSNRLAVNGVRA